MNYLDLYKDDVESLRREVVTAVRSATTALYFAAMKKDMTDNVVALTEVQEHLRKAAEIVYAKLIVAE